MNLALLDRMSPVTRRMRSQRFWRVISILAIIASLFTWLASRADGFGGVDLALSVSSGFAVAATLAWVLCRISFRQPRAVALRIEDRFPDLEQRLITAVGQTVDESKHDRPNGGELGYLQQRVIQEARNHSHTHRWADTVPAVQLFWSRLLGICSIALLGFVLASVVFTREADSTLTSPQNMAGFSVTIEPGSADVERGTSLVITARFSETDVPETAQLVCVNEQGDERVVTMTRNLSDPVVGGFLSSVKERFHYKVITPTFESDTFSIGVFDFPSLVRSDAHLNYPEYTGIDEKRIEDTVRISAIEGTKVTWLCFLNKQVAKAELVGTDGTRIELEGDRQSPGAVSATFDLVETKRFTLELTDEDGRQNKFPPELVARVLPNLPPELNLTSFGDTSVSPLEELPLEAEVQDDVGVSKAGLTYMLDGVAPVEITLNDDLPRGTQSALQHLVELESLGAEPDQLFSYHFWAEDIGPDGKIRRTQSDMFFAEVRPFDQIFREGQPPPGGQSPPQPSQNGQQAQALAELQKEIINATWRVIRQEIDDQRTDSFIENVDLLIESQLTAFEMLQSLAEKVQDPASKSLVEAAGEKMQQAFTELKRSKSGSDLEPLPLALQFEQGAYAGLLKLRAREIQVSKSSQSQGQPGSASQSQMQKQLDELELDQEQNRYESERTAQESSQEEQEQRETRQILNRLKELARRQEDLNNEIAELQNALEQAKSEEEREEVERRLKRLREQQQDLLRETDELSERMQQPENQQKMREANEQLQQTRENVQKASEALDQQDTTEALSAGRRAERQFEEMRDEFRRQASGQFDQTVKEMRDQAQDLDRREEELAEQLNRLNDPRESAGLRGDDGADQIREELQNQRKRLQSLQEQMQDTVQQAEVAEPLLAQNLYDSFRRTQQQQIDQQLNNTDELLRRGFELQAQEMERGAREQIDQLREALEQAASSVLGDETKALQRALGELEQLEREINQEIEDNQSAELAGGDDRPRTGEPGERAGGEPSESTGSSRPPSESSPNESSPSESSPSESSPSGTEPNESPADSNQGNAPAPAGTEAERQDAANQESADQESLGPGSSPSKPNHNQTAGGGGAERPGGRLDRIAEVRRRSAPLAGDDFREWSDRLRDVEEMVDDPELSNRAAQIRDRAREVRRDLRRNNEAPRWDFVESMIATPLRELKQQVSDELMRRSAQRNAPVPIDRDPVPAEFSDAVERYYESLGSGR